MAYERRSYSGNAVASQLAAGIGAGDTSLTLTVATGWPDTTGGPFYATIDEGTATEERIKVTTRTGTALNPVTRGADGTSAVSHAINAPITHSHSKTDLDEANAHYADTTLDHHSQYARTDGTRTITGTQTISRATAGVGLNVTKEAVSLQAGSITVNRSATNKPTSVSFATGVAYGMSIGQAASSDALDIGRYDGSAYLRMFSFTPGGYLIQRMNGSDVTGAALAASEGAFFIDEAGNALRFRYKYVDGVTVKLGTMALV